MIQRERHRKRLKQLLSRNPVVAILGARQVGKTTLARLIAAQLKPMEGDMASSPKMNVGYFTQYQVEELDGILKHTQMCKKPTAILTDASFWRTAQ